MKNNLVYEIRLINKSDKPEAVDNLSNELFMHDFALEEIVEFNDGLEKGISFFAYDKTKLSDYKRRLKAVDFKEFNCRVIKLHKEDWQTKWKEDFKPFYITKNIRIVPYEYRQKVSLKKGRDIFIDTDVVFGSGLHPTTQLCAELLNEKKGSYENVLDIGIGTGILSLIALHYGAKKISGLDIDAEAIETTKKNFQLNCSEFADLRVGDFKEFKTQEKFDVVIANIISPDLIALKKEILSRVAPEKFLIVSGISFHNYESFRKQFDSSQLRCLRVKKREGWCALLYKRIS